MAHEPASDDDLSPPALWDVACDLFGWLVSLCGTPIALAGCIIMPDERADILAWLRPLEALARRLLLIEAAALAPQLSGTRPQRRRTKHERRLVEQDMMDSARWRVSFRVLPASSSLPAVKRRPSTPEPSNAWPIAERMEAVARVLADPAPFARRLARRLLRKPKAARGLTRSPTPGKRRGPANTALAAASAEAARVVAVFDSG